MSTFEMRILLMDPSIKVIPARYDYYRISLQGMITTGYPCKV